MPHPILSFRTSYALAPRFSSIVKAILKERAGSECVPKGQTDQ